MDFDNTDELWTRKGGTLSDKSARKEFGLTQQELIEAIRKGKLQYREGNIYGNPFLRLLRSEVEALVRSKHGTAYLDRKKLQKELDQINKELRAMKIKTTQLEKRKAELLASLGQ